MTIDNFLIIIPVYLLIINLVLFVVMGLDKAKAKNRARRIPEKTLFLLCAVGGSIGGILGMLVFRHKTRHKTFVFGFPLILFLQVILAAFAFMVLFK